MSEQYRLECEAREWLKRTGRDPAKIKALLARLEQRRGQFPVRLRAEMLKQFREAQS